MERSELRKLWKISFQEDEEYLDFFFSSVYSPSRCRCITRDGKPAAALHWLDCSCQGQRLAYVYAVATHPALRGQGLCRRLMDEAHTALAGQGYAGTLLVPAEEGLRAMYAKMGYRACGGMREFSCSGGAPLPLRRVGPEEYAALRRRLLGPKGVIQEGENLLLLAQFHQLYAGDNLLLAAATQDGKLFVPELLGDPAAAPGVTAALGFPMGTFRVPGSGPFAMFRPLREDTATPDYFGLAFD